MVLQDKGFSLVEEKNIFKSCAIDWNKKNERYSSKKKKEVKVIPLKILMQIQYK